ncbi:MAG: DUF4340 domain-containing protein [Roseburia sp.]|nr:DUF4340 domain-containing protein [Roseburia sp.]MCM1099277.1 DUF4340 domain-containing protein [Ruminococcus flavefaciens]
MGRYKKIGILLAVLAALSAAAFGVGRYEEEKELIRNSDEVILAIDSETVSELSWEYESGLLSFHKDGEWIYDGDEAFPVDGEKMEELLSVFRELGASFVIEEVEDYGQYGLEDPVCKISLTAGNLSYEVSLGAFSTMDSQRYVRISEVSEGNASGEGNPGEESKTASESGASEEGNTAKPQGEGSSGETGRVYLVKTDPLDYFDAELADLIDHDEKLSYDEIVAIAFTGEENQKIVYEEEGGSSYCPDDVYFLEAGESGLPLDSSRVESYLRAVKNLRLTDYVTYNATAEELESCGLDQPELTVAVNYISEGEEEAYSGTYTLSVSRSLEDKERAAELSREEGDAEGSAEDVNNCGETAAEDSDEDVTAYVRIGNSQIIYRISASEYHTLMDVSYDSLRHPEVFTADFGEVSRIDIRLEDADYVITSGDEDGVRSYFYREEEIDLSAFRTALRVLSADAFTDEEPTQKEEIGLTVYLDNENYPAVEIGLYRYDGTRCLAALDGKPVSFVSRESVIELIEAVNAIVLNETAH